jgi:uncharacterized FlgJ-related protein
MIYKYDKTNLNYKDITKLVLLIGVSVVLVLTTWITLFTLNNVNDIRNISQETKAIIIKEANKENEFNKERLRAYILELNIRYPHIVLAQAELETGGFKSHIFKTNNNIFGMKEATRRPTTNKGTENGHAYYSNWRESVQDYAMFAAAYLNDLRTENEYFEYLSLNYAEDKGYVNKLKEIIKRNNTLN